MSARLPTELWVKAHGARCSAAGVPMVVVRRGDPHRGLVVVKLLHREAGFHVFTQTRDLDGDLAWATAFDGVRVVEAEADDYIARQVSYDPDLWIIEIEGGAEAGWFQGVVT